MLQEYLTRRNIRLVLASASPRRKELFHQAGLFPEILPSRREERSRAKTPAALVKALSKTKAEDIAFSDSMGHTFYALTDGSYLLQTENLAEIRGEAYMIRDGAISQVCTDGSSFKL